MWAEDWEREEALAARDDLSCAGDEPERPTRAELRLDELEIRAHRENTYRRTHVRRGGWTRYQP